MPIGFAGPRLVLAVADPADAHGAGALPALAGRKILPAVATAAALEQLIERLPLPQPAGELEAVDDPPAEHVEAEPAPAAARAAGHRRGDGRRREEEYELRARLSKAETRLDEALVRSREHHRELATARMEVEARTMELEVLRTKLTDAESDAIRARAEAEHAAHEARTLRARLDTEARRRAAARGAPLEAWRPSCSRPSAPARSCARPRRGCGAARSPEQGRTGAT